MTNLKTEKEAGFEPIDNLFSAEFPNENLKTLKDLKKNVEVHHKTLEIVKDEAIKRAKHHISLLISCRFSVIDYGSPFFEAINSKKGISDDDYYLMGKIVEIVEFNNISEKDLKTEKRGLAK